jgi:TIR domain
VPTPPSTFLCYRRADEPFATALLGTALIDRLGESRVFLDTVSLDRGPAFEAKLIAAARSADVMLVVIGQRWDRGRNRERLDQDDDWVRTEIFQAEDAGRRIMLVLVERDPGPIDLPAALDFLRGCETVALRRPDVSGKLAGIADTITGESTAVPAGGHLDRTTVERATLAMIRHVLPDRQQFGGNDEAVARAVADHLAPGEWLRFAGAGNSPGRPGGSGVVMVTDEQLRLVQLRPRRGLRFGVQTAEATSRPLRPQTTLRATPRRSFFRDLVDVHVEAPGSEPLPVLGLFPRPAEILLEVAAQASRRTEG